MLKWGWDTKKTELVNLTRFGCNNLLSTRRSRKCCQRRSNSDNILGCGERGDWKGIQIPLKASRWCPNIECWLGRFVIFFRESGQAFLGNPIDLWIFSGGGRTHYSPSGSAHVEIWMPYIKLYQSPLILTALFQHNLINVSYLTACYLYQVMMTLHFLYDVANDAESTQKSKITS